MTPCQLTDSRIHGFNCSVLSNDWLSLTIVPYLGGKLMSLYDRKHQLEWLWTNPLLTHLRPLAGEHSTEQFELGGWDECFPAVAGGAYPLPPWTELAIPEYGDLWSHDWKKAVLESSPARIGIRTSTEGENLPYTFERIVAIRATEAAVYFHYRLCNESRVPMPFVWSSHPLLRVEPGMRILLPVSTQVWVDHALPAGTMDAGTQGLWPRLAVKQRVRDLSVVPAAAEGWAAKLYTVNLAEGWVALEYPSTGRTLRFDFDLKQIPTVGLWLNYGGWGGREMRPCYHLGLMPCVGGADNLGNAIKRGNTGILPPAGEKSWDLTVTIS